MPVGETDAANQFVVSQPRRFVAQRLHRFANPRRFVVRHRLQFAASLHQFAVLRRRSVAVGNEFVVSDGFLAVTDSER